MKKTLFLAFYAVVGWAICGATIALGRRGLDLQTTLIIHAVIAPMAFAVLVILFFRQFPDSRPARSAFAFVAIVIGLDLFLVAPLFEHSFSMFRSFLGTWLPFALIFSAVFAVGTYVSHCFLRGSVYS